MASLIELCNRALAAIAKGHIDSLNEPSPEARECKRQAQPLLDEMITWSDMMPLGRKRVALAQLTTDRPAEWLYAYALPSDFETAISIRGVEEAATELPEGGPWVLPMQDTYPLSYLIEGTTLYTNVPGATLNYVRSTIEPSELSGQMQKAFVDELAVRIAMPLTKDPKIPASLANVAELSRARAVANEENKMNYRQPEYVSEAEMARMGIMR